MREMWFVDYSYNCWFNPLATDDAFWHCLTLVVCYQLAQCIENRFCTRKKIFGTGEAGGHSHDMLCALRLSWPAIEKPWSALARSFLTLLAQMGAKNILLSLLFSQAKHSLVEEP